MSGRGDKAVRKMKAAILGPGNIGTDLLIKLGRSEAVEVALVVGIYPESAGLARARELGIETSADGLDAILSRDDIELVFDATEAKAHQEAAPRLEAASKLVVDLTPAAVGPYVVPAVNLDEHLDRTNVNMVTCGGQATIPMVHAVNRVAVVSYAEIVATIASAGAGPGTRANIDEFTETTAKGLETVGGATRAKAIIILNPAEPPIMMRGTIYAQVADEVDEAAIRKSIDEVVAEIGTYVPGYRLLLLEFERGKVTIMIEVEGQGDFLPVFAGNLDIMTAAAARVGNEMALRRIAL
jgi:acetaldehyde dehydrogenase (acetylating)